MNTHMCNVSINEVGGEAQQDDRLITVASIIASHLVY